MKSKCSLASLTLVVASAVDLTRLLVSSSNNGDNSDNTKANERQPNLWLLLVGIGPFMATSVSIHYHQLFVCVDFSGIGKLLVADSQVHCVAN